MRAWARAVAATAVAVLCAAADNDAGLTTVASWGPTADQGDARDGRALAGADVSLGAVITGQERDRVEPWTVSRGAVVTGAIRRGEAESSRTVAAGHAVAPLPLCQRRGAGASRCERERRAGPSEQTVETVYITLNHPTRQQVRSTGVLLAVRVFVPRAL